MSDSTYIVIVFISAATGSIISAMSITKTARLVVATAWIVIAVGALIAEVVS